MKALVKGHDRAGPGGDSKILVGKEQLLRAKLGNEEMGLRQCLCLLRDKRNLTLGLEPRAMDSLNQGVGKETNRIQDEEKWLRSVSAQ